MPGDAASDLPELRDDGSIGTLAPPSTLVLDELSRAAAVDAGAHVMTLFARPWLPADQWWNELVPLMTSQVAQAYRYTDPRNVRPTRVTGGARLTPASTPKVARISVPTDAGVYLVILSRSNQDSRWLAERILPPEGAGDS